MFVSHIMRSTGLLGLLQSKLAAWAVLARVANKANKARVKSRRID
ncbi:hypothetical protein [Undibacterium sp. TC9W]